MVSDETAKDLLAPHGTLRPQSAMEWDGLIPLPPAVEWFYRQVGPVNVTVQGYGNPYFFPALADLWKLQAGYRWNGLSGERLEDWDDDWLMVAEQGGDPFIFARSTGEVLLAYHGEGSWDPTELFPDLNTMAACLATLGAIAVDHREEYVDEESYIRPEFMAIARTRLGELLGSQLDSYSALETLGWASNPKGEQ